MKPQEILIFENFRNSSVKVPTLTCTFVSESPLLFLTPGCGNFFILNVRTVAGSEHHYRNQLKTDKYSLHTLDGTKKRRKKRGRLIKKKQKKKNIVVIPGLDISKLLDSTGLPMGDPLEIHRLAHLLWTMLLILVVFM